MKKNKSELKMGATHKFSDPMELLKADHKLVKDLFEEFENSEDDSRKEEIIQETLIELKIHTTVEEELFYPAAHEKFRGKEEAKELLDEAYEEHHVVDLLMDELKDMTAEDDGYFAKFTVLVENVQHHIKEEEGELMPKLKGKKEEWQELAEKMATRKEELKSEAGHELKHGSLRKRMNVDR